MRYELTDAISEIMGVDIPERGVNALLLCPLHDEDTASFSIHLDNGLWQCFGCGKKGNLERLAYLLGEEINDDTKQDILIRSLSVSETAPARRNFAPVANGYIQALQSKRGQSILRDYLERRRLPDSVAVAFGIGYDESRDCLALPYWDQGTVTGIKFRARDAGKYSYPDSTYGLYNVEDLRGKPVVVLTEGESDCHYAWSRLQTTDIGVGGTSGALSSERLWGLFALDLLFARTVYIAYDADDAGDAAFEKAAQILGDKAVRVRPTKGKDITESALRGEHIDALIAACNMPS